MPNEGLNKTIKDATVEIDRKILLIDRLLSKAQKGTESYNSLESAKAELVSFKSKVADEKNWKEADYIQRKEGDAKYLLKTGSVGGYTPEQYVKNLIEKIDYKSEKSPFKEIVLDYNKGVSAESTKGVKPILNESVLGLGGEEKKQNNSTMPKDGDKYTLNGKIYTYKSDSDTWVRRVNNEQGGADGKELKNEDFQSYIKEGDAQPLKTFKYSGVDYRYNPTDGKWYDKEGRAASEGITERINTLGKFDVKKEDIDAQKGKAPVTGGLNAAAEGAAVTKSTEKRSAEDIAKGGNFRLGIQDKPIPEAEKVIDQKAVAGTGVVPKVNTPLAREEQTNKEFPNTRITTLHGALYELNKTTGSGEAPLAKASMGDFFEPNTPIEKYNDVGLKGAIKDMDFSNVASYLPDVFKGVLGLYGASQKLPEFETPQYFTDYERKLKELSTQGLTDAEMATAKRDLDRTYAYDVNNIERFAGGRSGVALANLGRATNTLQGNTNALNVADAQMQRQNLAQYGGVVGTHLGLDQSAFNQKYQLAAQNKMAGAQLAADAFSNIQSRADYNQAYGKGSVYDKYQTSLLQGQNYLNDIYKYQTENPVPLPEYKPIIVTDQFIPQYQNQYTNQNGH